jgi:hypothetical protein
MIGVLHAATYLRKFVVTKGIQHSISPRWCWFARPPSRFDPGLLNDPGHAR